MPSPTRGEGAVTTSGEPTVKSLNWWIGHSSILATRYVRVMIIDIVLIRSRAQGRPGIG